MRSRALYTPPVTPWELETPEVDGLTRLGREAVAEGGADDCDEVVTRQPYGNVRLNHLLSKESMGNDNLMIPRSVNRLKAYC